MILQLHTAINIARNWTIEEAPGRLPDGTGLSPSVEPASSLAGYATSIPDAALHCWFELSIIAALAALTLFALFGSMPS